MVDYIQKQAIEQQLRYIRSSINPLEKHSPFQIWKGVFQQIFGLHKTKKMPEEEKQKIVLSKLASIDENWTQYGILIAYCVFNFFILAALLNNIVDVKFPQSQQTQELSPEHRRDITIQILVQFLFLSKLRIDCRSN